MLKNLTYTVTFQTTGRTLNEKISFQRGFGAITGPNESGKSMVLEMVRWLLFGSAALRGSASDYNKITGTLEFDVKAKPYVVRRTQSTATLWRDSVEIAVGTKPVNVKMAEILGFGLSVFDIACVANQNALLALGDMTPANRKRMVDSVIGLGVIEDLSKSAGEEANALKRRYEDMMSDLREPVEPVQPPNYVPSKDLSEKLNELRTQKSELDQIVGWLSVDKPKVKKPETDIPMDSSTLQELVDTQNGLRAREVELSKQTKPQYTQQELEVFAEQNASHENTRRLKGLLDREGMLITELISCPACGHEWAADGHALNTVQTEIEMLKKQGEFSDKPSPLLSSAIERELERIKLWDEGQSIELEQIRKTLSKQQDFRSMLMQRQKFELALAQYESELQSYDEWRRKYDEKNALRMELELAVAELPDVQTSYEVAREYENHLAFYQTVAAKYKESINLASEIKTESENWNKARIALTNLRAKVKQHLVPSLNKVASHLLQEMTGGQRQQIVVTEEFDISVDGQSLSTLSGSGMAVANLAIRLGLGQVLTNNIMSLFMADEIDASMDVNRAEHTANALQNLRSSISQILLVTHKSPEADYYIQLGTDYAETD